MKNALVCVAMAVSALASTGCATAEKKVAPGLISASKGRGDVFISSRPQLPGRAKYTVKYRIHKKFVPDTVTLVTLGDGFGNDTGQYISKAAPRQMLTEELKEGLSVAGYTVMVDQRPLSSVRKGIEIDGLYVNCHEVSGLIDTEAACTFDVELNLWRHGVKVNKLRFATDSKDSCYGDGTGLIRDVMTKAFESISEQAMPNLVNNLEM